MKKHLLLTTALVAVISATNASATETIVSENVENSPTTAYTNNNGDTLTVKDNIIFTKNSSAVVGAGIHNSGTLNIGNGVKFIDNTASDKGAAIYSENASGKITIGNDVHFNNNKASAGAVFLFDVNDVTIGNGVKFINNDLTAPAALRTGALSIVGTSEHSNSVTIGDNAEFSGNKAFYGSAIYIGYTGDTVTIGKNAIFDNNSGDDLGGAILNGGTLKIDNGATFSRNKAYRGSAIANMGTIQLKDVSFKNNEASALATFYNDYTGKATFSGNTTFE